MSIINDLKELGVDLTDEQKELLQLDEMLSFEQDENAQLQGQVLRLKSELKDVKEERDELQESIIELDPTYGDIALQSDRAYEMRYD